MTDTCHQRGARPPGWLAGCLGLLLCALPPAAAGAAAGPVALPDPRADGPVSVERALRERRSLRHHAAGALSLADAGQLLWAAQGVSGRGGLRTAPSAGALYPLETYLLAGEVSGLAPGVYRYDPARHRLHAVAAGDRRRDLAAAAWGQGFMARTPAVIVLAAVPERVTRKYGRRGERYVHMEAGHAAQNVYLQAAALGLGTVAVGAFSDRAVKGIAALAADQQPLYLLPVGRPR